jgi:hypothetical protein
LYQPVDVHSTTSTKAHSHPKFHVSELGQHSPTYQQHLYVATYQSTLVDPVKRAAYSVQFLSTPSINNPTTEYQVPISVSTGTPNPPPFTSPSTLTDIQQGWTNNPLNPQLTIASTHKQLKQQKEQHQVKWDPKDPISVKSGVAICPETYRGNGEFLTATSKVPNAQ